MIKISHRGNIDGPQPTKENRPSYIDAAIQLGYDVEIDIRLIKSELWLGHDYGEYKVSLKWLDLRKDKLWIHCKDKDSASYLIESKKGFQFFCHTQDEYVLTSTNHLWVHDLTCTIDDTCIIPLMTLSSLELYDGEVPFAICSNYVSKINY